MHPRLAPVDRGNDTRSSAPIAPVGRFAWDLATGRWAWSAEMFRLHGYPPNSVRPTTELVLQHQHPADREFAHGFLQAAMTDTAPASCYHRIIDAQGAQRTVLIVGQGDSGPDGTGVRRFSGFMVDVSDGERQAIGAAIDGVLRHRAVIEQVKGMLMLAYGLTPDQAFALLRWHSQQHNIRLTTLAGRFLQTVNGSRGGQIPTRVTLDRILFEASQGDPWPALPATDGQRPALLGEGSQA